MRIAVLLFSVLDLLMDPSVLVSFWIDAELVVIARKDDVEQDSRDGCDRQGGQGNRSLTDIEGDAV